MLRSGNDAAITLAISVSKTIENFVDLMNKKADELNLKNTIFSEAMILLTSLLLKLQLFNNNKNMNNNIFFIKPPILIYVLFFVNKTKNISIYHPYLSLNYMLSIIFFIYSVQKNL